jgi:hypothetical protein
MKTKKKNEKQNKTKKNKVTKEPFIVIGGVGGSGTRLIAMMLSGLGLNIGSNLNDPLDNNVFVYLFRRIQTLDVIKDKKLFQMYLSILRKTFCETKEKLNQKEKKLIDELSHIKNTGISYKWLEENSELIKKNVKDGPLQEGVEHIESIRNKYQLEQPLTGKWGWKAPNSHVIMKELFEEYPNMKYIMVVRNGLDMAYSDNQGQLALWGPLLFPEKELKNGWKKSPRLSLKYWRLVHERVLKDSKGQNFLWLDYDKLCAHPDAHLPILFDFLNIPHDYIESVKPMIKVSSGVGRFKEHKNVFDQEDIEYVKQLGYDIF